MTQDTRESVPPPSDALPSFRPPAPRAPAPLLAAWSERLSAFVEAMGGIGILAGRTLTSLPRRPFETAATIYLGAFRYEQLFYLYVGISLALGAFLALRGFAHKG